ncbi:mRNA decay activator protein ZFP36L1 [Bagarius yarrelli]|uniref:mRNA decay activator protein ZFP36 n=1 Tax=Bagarius yarrelli TaxID=175774 RepID=A0A556V7I2_BAGYA|nr:mRNA decay activator protein ZFP36L1 [Bagarius yarrelli]
MTADDILFEFLHMEMVFTKDCLTFKDDLEVIKFVCKDFWNGIFRKQIDNLRTNHQGTYVLQDNRFALLTQISCRKQQLDESSKQLLNLDLGPLRTVAPSSAGGHQNPGAITSNQLVQSRDVSPPSSWSKVGFWSERAVSLVEGETGGLGWACDGPGSVSSSASFSSSTSSVSSGAASSRYKTELCRTFTERGACKYGSKCQFAHGAEELRGINRHPKYKTEPCRTFHSIGFCPYGIRCHFVHNNDDDGPLRPQKPTSAKRPPLLKQSFSFAGFPSNPTPLEPPFSQSSFLAAPSASPPSSGTISDLLATAFPEFLPSHDSGCCSAEPTPTTSPIQTAPEQSFSTSLSTRSQSLTSLSDHEGRCGSSASSLSGSDLSSAQDAAARRLPIFSQLSVPDGFCTDSSFSFFL